MKREHPLRDRGAGRLVAGDGEQQEEEVELDLGQPLAVDLGLEQHADDVVGRAAAVDRGALLAPSRFAHAKISPIARPSRAAVAAVLGLVEADDAGC